MAGARIAVTFDVDVNLAAVDPGRAGRVAGVEADHRRRIRRAGLEVAPDLETAALKRRVVLQPDAVLPRVRLDHELIRRVVEAARVEQDTNRAVTEQDAGPLGFLRPVDQRRAVLELQPGCRRAGEVLDLNVAAAGGLQVSPRHARS